MIERRGMQLVKGGAAAQPETAPSTIDNPFVGEFEVRCRLCRISKTYPELARIIHELHFRERMPYRAIADEANNLIVADGLELEPLQISGFVAHFRDHVPAEQAYAFEMQAKALPQRARPAQQTELMQQVIAAKRESVENVKKNLDRWQKVFDMLAARTGMDTAGDNPDAAFGFSSDDVTDLKNATAAIATLSSVLDRYVKDRAFVMDVLDKGLDLYGGLVVAKLATGLMRIIQASDQRDARDPQTLRWFEYEVKALAEDAVVGTLDQARKDTIEKFNL